MWTELNTVCHESVTTWRVLTLICFTTKLCMLGSPFLGLFTDIKAKLKFDTNHFQAVLFIFAHAVTRSYFHSNFVTLKVILHLWIPDLCKRSLELKNSFYLLWQLLMLERPSCLRPCWDGNSLYIYWELHAPYRFKSGFSPKIFTARQRSCWKVMFSIVPVCLLFTGESHCDHYPWCIGPHHAGTSPPCPISNPLCTGITHP